MICSSLSWRTYRLASFAQRAWYVGNGGLYQPATSFGHMSAFSIMQSYLHTCVSYML